MVISDEAVENICQILTMTAKMDLDEILILSNAVIEQTQEKSKLKGPREIIFMTLANRFKKRIKEGYVPGEKAVRIAELILGRKLE